MASALRAGSEKDGSPGATRSDFGSSVSTHRSDGQSTSADDERCVRTTARSPQFTRSDRIGPDDEFDLRYWVTGQGVVRGVSGGDQPPSEEVGSVGTRGSMERGTHTETVGIPRKNSIVIRISVPRNAARPNSVRRRFR